MSDTVKDMVDQLVSKEYENREKKTGEKKE